MSPEPGKKKPSDSGDEIKFTDMAPQDPSDAQDAKPFEEVTRREPPKSLPPIIVRNPTPKPRPRPTPAPAFRAPDSATTDEQPEEEAHYAFVGSGAGLLLIRLGRVIALAVATAALFHAFAMSNPRLPASFTPPARIAPEVQRARQRWPEVQRALPKLPPAVPRWTPLVVAGVAILLAMRATTAARVYRIRHTELFGYPLAYRPGCGIGPAIGDGLLLSLTAGLATPWVIAGRVARTVRSCGAPSSLGRPLDFTGKGGDVVGIAVLSLVLAPIAVATLGLGAIPIRFWWARWEQSHLLIPDPKETVMRSVRFDGTLGRFFLHETPRWLLTVLTLGLFAPWARVARWRWIAANTAVVM